MASKSTAVKKTSTATALKKTSAKSARAPKAAADKRASREIASKAAIKARREKALVIVESPAKAKTIKKYLGQGYTVKASVGHIKDLPGKTTIAGDRKSKLGVDVDHGFVPEYEVIRGKAKIIAEIKKSA